MRDRLALNLSRIVSLALVLLVLRALVGIVSASFPVRGQVDVQFVLQYVITYAMDAAVVFAVFFFLARRQSRLLYLHVFIVVVLQELLGIAALFATGRTNPSSPLWVVDWAVLVFSVLAGTEMGRRTKRTSGPDGD